MAVGLESPFGGHREGYRPLGQLSPGGPWFPSVSRTDGRTCVHLEQNDDKPRRVATSLHVVPTVLFGQPY